MNSIMSQYRNDIITFKETRKKIETLRYRKISQPTHHKHMKSYKSYRFDHNEYLFTDV